MSRNIFSFKGIKQWALYITCISLACFPFQKSYSQNLIFDQRPANFTDVAKKGIPAVVSISVKMKAKDRSSSSFGNNREREPYGGREREREYEDPFDFFQDNFFRQFFGQPRRERYREPQEEQQHVGQASGFIVRNDGYVLTNGHVVQNAEDIEILLNDGREFEGKLIGIDPNTDIAVVKIDAQNLPYLPLGNSDDVEVGQWVIAIGNPLGLQASVTAGVISAKGRNNLDLANIEDFIQTDAAINRGNSGGPLLNLNGEAIGMNTAIVTDMGSGGYMGIGFAIPSNLAKHVMEQLIATGSTTRGFMGVTLQQMNQDLARAFNLDKAEGALVSSVAENSPAAQAGIQQGDVILKYNGKKVANIAALRNAVSLMKPGSKIDLVILREGQKITLPFTVGTFPEDTAIKEEITNKLGIKVEVLTPDIAKRLGYGEDAQGVVVTGVEPGSPAAWAGIRKGILILSVNRQEVNSTADFYRIVNESEGPVLLLVKMGDTMHFVSIKIK